MLAGDFCLPNTLPWWAPRCIGLNTELITFPPLTHFLRFTGTGLVCLRIGAILLLIIECLRCPSVDLGTIPALLMFELFVSVIYLPIRLSDGMYVSSKYWL